MQNTPDLDKLAKNMFNARTPEELAAMFSKGVDSLPTSAQRVLADKIEAIFLTQVTPESHMNAAWFAERKAYFESDPAQCRAFAGLTGLTAEAAQAEAEAMGYVARIKGKEAHPLVGAYIDGISKLSDADYSDNLAHVKVIFAVMESAGPKPRPNPFAATRKQPKPGQA